MKAELRKLAVAARAERIVAAVKSGKTIAQIARDEGMSRARIDQQYSNHIRYERFKRAESDLGPEKYEALRVAESHLRKWCVFANGRALRDDINLMSAIISGREPVPPNIDEIIAEAMRYVSPFDHKFQVGDEVEIQKCTADLNGQRGEVRDISQRVVIGVLLPGHSALTLIPPTCLSAAAAHP